MRHVFVWTLSDIVGLVIFGIVALLGIAFGAMVLWEKAVRAWRLRP